MISPQAGHVYQLGGSFRIESFYGCGLVGVETRAWAAIEIYFTTYYDFFPSGLRLAAASYFKTIQR